LPHRSAHRQHLGGQAGATLRELTDRMGDASACSALVYIQSRDNRHTRVAQAMSELVIDGLQDVAKTADSKSRAQASST